MRSILKRVQNLLSYWVEVKFVQRLDGVGLVLSGYPAILAQADHHVGECL